MESDRDCEEENEVTAYGAVLQVYGMRRSESGYEITGFHKTGAHQDILLHKVQTGDRPGASGNEMIRRYEWNLML